MECDKMNFIKFLKQYHVVPILLIFFFLYLIIGACAPFFRYKPLSEKTEETIHSAKYVQGTPGCERVMLLETNMSAWEERMRMIQLAQKEIILSTFDFRDGEAPRDILSLLLHKADEGVKVKILVDGFSGLVRMEGRSLFYALSSHPNVEIKIYNPMNPFLPWKTQGRMHDKYVIVDNSVFILGGRNTFDYFIGDYPTNSRSYDREVLVYNPQPQNGPGDGLLQVRAYFESVWNLPDCKIFHDSEKLASRKGVQKERQTLTKRYQTLSDARPDLFQSDETSIRQYYLDNTFEAGKITLLSNPTHLYGKEPVVFSAITHLIENAQSSVIFHTPYIVLNDYMYDTLKAAGKHVPDIKIMINSVENGDNFFASSDYIRRKKWMAGLGIPIYEYDGGTSYHGKSLVIDNTLSLIGSYNLDLRSTYMDTELMLAIESPDLARQLTGYMEQYHKDCRRLLEDGTYEIPEHITIASVPAWKKAAWTIVGFIMQPFRFLL
ncbi:MAG: phospholipase D-like domain-containing protein [Lachnospiraceae bacterium]